MIPISEQDKIYLVDVDKVIYRNGELRRCYFVVGSSYLLRTYFKNGKEYGILMNFLDPNNSIVRHVPLSDIYSTEEEAKGIVNKLNQAEEAKCPKEMENA